LAIAELAMRILISYAHGPQSEIRILYSAASSLSRPKTAGRPAFPDSAHRRCRHALRRDEHSRPERSSGRKILKSGTQHAQSSTFNLQSLIYNLPTIKTPLPGGSWWQRGKFIEEVIPAIIMLR
jgi:hypothetical protein